MNLDLSNNQYQLKVIRMMRHILIENRLKIALDSCTMDSEMNKMTGGDTYG